MTLSLERARPSFSAAFLAIAAFHGAACAGGAMAGRAGGGSPRQTLGEPLRGWSLELPADGHFVPSAREGEVARSTSGVVVRVTSEHFASAPDANACWGRLLVRLRERLPSEARSPQALEAAGRRGFEVAGHRRYLSVSTRERECLVLEVGGADGTPGLASAAVMAAETFSVRSPSTEAGPRIAAEAGMQLFDLGEHSAAADRFEEALVADPDDPQLQLAAGVAAYFAGPTQAPRAVAHLERALALRGEAERRGAGIEENRLRNALMYLGLAQSSLKAYGRAIDRLAELVTRYPDDSVGRYNFACVLALAGDSDGALANLGEALRREPGLAEHARDDEDLVSLRARPEWPAIVNQPAIER
jgi:tetratricopeptide (TPR) repeat protein